MNQDELDRSGDAILKKVTQAVRSAGDIARQGFRRSRVVIEKSRASVATDVDLRVEKHLISFLLKEFPDHGILAEEAGDVNTGSEYTWVIDPIDGTRYFHRGLPIYAISVALKHHDDLQLGVVYLPEMDEMFTALKAEGARLNGKEIRCSTESVLENTLVAVELPTRHETEGELDRALVRLKVLIRACQRVRILGLSSFAMCHVACGGFDAYVNLGSAPNEWDIAGSEIVVTESGGIVTWRGPVIIVGNKVLHDSIVNLLGL